MVQTRQQRRELPIDEASHQLEEEDDTISNEESQLWSSGIPPFAEMYKAILLADYEQVESIIEKYPSVLSERVHPWDFEKCKETFNRQSLNIDIDYTDLQRYNNMILSDSVLDVVFSCPLVWACTIADHKMVKLLIDKYPMACSFKVHNPANITFDYPLHTALVTNHDFDDDVYWRFDIMEQIADIVELLVKQCPDAVNTKGIDDLLPVEMAFDSLLPDAVDHLLDHTFDQKFTVDRLRWMLERPGEPHLIMVLVLLSQLKFNDFATLFENLGPIQNQQDDDHRLSDRPWKHRDRTLFSLFYDKVFLMSFQEFSECFYLFFSNDNSEEFLGHDLFENAVGSVPLDIVQCLIHKYPKMISSCWGPILAVSNQAKKYPGDWDEYYKPIFQEMIKVITEDYIFIEDVEDGSSKSLMHSWTIYQNKRDKVGRHFLHELADLGMPYHGIQMVLSIDVNMLNIPDNRTGLLVFMVAAAGQSSLSTVYELFRKKPDTLSIFFHKSMYWPSTYQLGISESAFEREGRTNRLKRKRTSNRKDSVTENIWIGDNMRNK